MSEILLEVTRGELAENLLRGSIAVLGGEGRLLAYAGDPDYVSYMRSAAKPLQASALMETGAAERYAFSDDEIAVMCGSHIGDDYHVAAIQSILDKIGLDESAFTLGPELSMSHTLREKRIAAHAAPRKIYNNCSGKHSCMLALCQYFAYDHSAYQQPWHPVQQMILSTVAAYTHMNEADIIVGVDGCGVPVFAMPLRHMARAYLDLCNPERLPEARSAAASRLISAMAAYPQMVAGYGQFCTELITATQGRIIGKLGADGVYCCAPRQGNIAVALKMEDGNAKALAPVMMSVLSQLDLLTEQEQEALSKFAAIANYNYQHDQVGQWRPVFELHEA